MQAEATRAALFSVSCVALVLAFLRLPRDRHARGSARSLIAVRDAESRMRFLGYRVEGYKLFVFMLSAGMAGVAGALYVPQVGIINPSEFAPGNSIEAVIWVAVGGRGTLIGAVIGAFARQLRQDLVDRGIPRAVLAVRAGRPVHRRHAVPAQGRRRHARSLDAAAARPRIGRGRGRRNRAVRGDEAAGASDRTMEALHLGAALSRRRHRLVRRLQGAEQPLAGRSSRARCAPSSAPTAPARPR